MAALVLGAAMRGGGLLAARAASGQIGVVVRNLAFGLAAAVTAALSVKTRTDSLQEDAITVLEDVTYDFQESLLIEPAAVQESLTLLHGAEVPNASRPILGEAERAGTAVSLDKLLNLGRLAVDVTRLGVELYKASTPDEGQRTPHRVYGRGRTLAETPVQTVAHAEAPQPPNGADPEEEKDKVARERYVKGNKEKRVPRKIRETQSHLTNEVHKLLLNKGNQVYQKMRNSAKVEYTNGSSRTIWSDKNYRFDAGHLDRATGSRKVMFQVNHKPASGGARELLRNKERGTDVQFFGFEFGTNNFPSYEDWSKIILEGSKNPR